MNRIYTRYIGAVALAIVSLGVFVDSTYACGVPEEPDPRDIRILFGAARSNSSTNVMIIFEGYETFGSSVGDFCVCALDQVAGIVSVDSVEFRNTATEALLTEFSFSPDPDSVFPGGDPWAGFSSEALVVPVAPGISFDIEFNVTVAHGTTFVDLANALSSAGNVIGTDLADGNGVPTGAHQYILSAGTITHSTSPIPTVSEWGLIIMTLLFLTAGTIVLGRQHRPAAA